MNEDIAVTAALFRTLNSKMDAIEHNVHQTCEVAFPPQLNPIQLLQRIEAMAGQLDQLKGQVTQLVTERAVLWECIRELVVQNRTRIAQIQQRLGISDPSAQGADLFPDLEDFEAICQKQAHDIFPPATSIEPKPTTSKSLEGTSASHNPKASTNKGPTTAPDPTRPVVGSPTRSSSKAGGVGTAKTGRAAEPVAAGAPRPVATRPTQQKRGEPFPTASPIETMDRDFEEGVEDADNEFGSQADFEAFHEQYAAIPETVRGMSDVDTAWGIYLPLARFFLEHPNSPPLSKAALTKLGVRIVGKKASDSVTCLTFLNLIKNVHRGISIPTDKLPL